ncbi:MAG TPA: EAL domain-containing protein [Polyangiaceae bacterium]|nr:EAL domain-containing protein [Polyangiaceae bacterium]
MEGKANGATDDEVIPEAAREIRRMLASVSARLRTLADGVTASDPRRETLCQIVEAVELATLRVEQLGVNAPAPRISALPRPPLVPAPGATDADRGTRITRVLVVDDEAALLRALKKTLTSAGYEVATALNGFEAEGMLAHSSFDVILSDVTMPGMDGIQLLRTVRRRDLDVPVILLTALPWGETAAEAVRLGALEYLQKPVDGEKLIRLVERAAQMHEMARVKRSARTFLGGRPSEAGDLAGLDVVFDRMLTSLWMAYQPIVHAQTRTLFGYESLLRSAEPALPHPGAVLKAAEKLDRLQDLGRVIRCRAAEAVAKEPDAGALFVNLHPRDLCDDSLADPDAPLCQIASRVVLEITERASLDSVPDAKTRLAALRAVGFRIAIDDLGAGYAGLTSFATLEPEFVKLDMSLVRDVHQFPTKQKLIRSMTSLARDMGMMVVAEGIEAPEERDVLVDLGCDLLQGYLLAKPGKAFPLFTW